MDRTLRGLLAGVIAGIAMNVWNLSDYYFLHLTKIRFLDWASVLLAWSKPKTAVETVIYLIIHLLWDGFLAIIFSHLLVSITSRGLIIKSTIYSVLLWFFFKITVNIYRVPVLSGLQPFPGAMSNLLAVILFGIVLGLVLKKFDKPV